MPNNQTQTWLVSGTARGIGLELTRQLLAQGKQVIALARSISAELEALKKRHSDQLRIFPVDITSDEQVTKLSKQLGGEGIDVLINNAGIYGGDADFQSLDLTDVTHTITVNAVGPMRLTQALLPNLLKAPNLTMPKVANVTSLMGSIGDNSSGGSYGYRMSKAALNMFHKSFSVDFPKLISLVLHPGWVRTNMGGSAAPTSPEESVRGLLKVIEKAGPGDSGKFFDYEGEELPW